MTSSAHAIEFKRNTLGPGIHPLSFIVLMRPVRNLPHHIYIPSIQVIKAKKVLGLNGIKKKRKLRGKSPRIISSSSVCQELLY